MKHPRPTRRPPRADQAPAGPSREELLEDLRRLSAEVGFRALSRDYYRIHGRFPEAEWVRHFGAFAAFKAAAGVTAQENVARERTQAGENRVPPLPDGARPPPGMVVTSHSAAYGEGGELLRQWVGTSAAPGDEFQVPSGHVVKGESALVDPAGRVMAKWVKTREGVDPALLEKALEARFKAWEGAAPALAPPDRADGELLTVYPIPDLHFGMYAWAPEAGQDYDTAIAARLAREALRDLVAQARPSGRAVLLNLGDYFHSNDHTAATPRNKHRLDVDGRWEKVYEEGVGLMMEMVELVARRHREVEVVCLPGNHDEDAAVTLRVALGAFYRASPRIAVARTPGLVWYRRHGRVLLGGAHGHIVKPERMAMMMATDCAEDWGQSLYRHFFFGHIHHRTAQDIGGVEVESFTTPAPRDSFAQTNGYRAARALHALTFHAERGEAQRLRVNFPPPRQAKAALGGK